MIAIIRRNIPEKGCQSNRTMTTSRKLKGGPESPGITHPKILALKEPLLQQPNQLPWIGVIQLSDNDQQSAQVRCLIFYSEQKKTRGQVSRKPDREVRSLLHG